MDIIPVDEDHEKKIERLAEELWQITKKRMDEKKSQPSVLKQFYYDSIAIVAQIVAKRTGRPVSEKILSRSQWRVP